jgi:putative spermidine/putrescine transport system ATP-binding protein
VRLESFSQRKPNQISGGQQQRVALARALVFEPRLVLMDEPLSALDKKLREEMQLEIRRLHRELGVTMVFVTHDQSEAMTLSDRVAVFNHGRIEQLASPKELYDAPINPFVASFLGDNNMISVMSGSSGDNGQATVKTSDGLNLVARQRQGHGNASAAAATLCVRPEFLRVASDASALGTNNCIGATLVDLIHQGDHWRLVAQLGGATTGPANERPQWFAKINPGALPQGLVVGQNLCLGFRSEDAWVF